MQRIICSVITPEIEDLAKKIGESSELTNIMVSAWQTANNTDRLPSEDTLKNRDKSQDSYYDTALMNYGQFLYEGSQSFYPKNDNRNSIPALSAGVTVSLEQFIKDFLKYFHDVEGLKDIIDSTQNPFNAASRFLVYRQMYLIQHDFFNRKSEQPQILKDANNDALRKLKLYRSQRKKEKKGNTTNSTNTGGSKIQSPQYTSETTEHYSQDLISPQLVSFLQSKGITVHGRADMIKYIQKYGLNSVQRQIERERGPILPEVRAEMDAIKEKAIADGTFMKAPNGKPTKLNEEQWLLVRTKNFKEWFGDWEKVARSNKYNSEGLSYTSATYNGVTVTSQKFDPDMAPDGGTRMIFIGDEYIGEFPTVETSDKIRLAGSLGSATSITEKYRGKGYGTKAYIALANIAKAEGKVLYSDSSMTDDAVRLWESLVKRGLAEQVKENKGKLGGGAFNFVQYRIINEALPNAEDVHRADDDVSKVVDENGEPLVVYHGDDDTNIHSWEDKFKGSIHGYFTPSLESANLYKSSGKIYDAFLNIKRPYTWTRNDQNYRDENSIWGDWSNIDKYVAANLISLGYDGIYIPEYSNSYLAIKAPTQIKSATDNNGAFSTENDDIQMLIVGEKGVKSLDAAEEATTRMDNLAIANEMEKAGKAASKANSSIITVNLTQNAAGRLHTFPLNEQDYNIINEAYDTLNDKRASAAQKQRAANVISLIEQRRTAQMQRIIEDILYDVDGVELEGIDKGTGIYEGDVEYTSNIRLRVEKGKEKTAQALMALVAQATRQDAFIENFNEEFASSGKRDYLTEYSPTVKVKSKIRISPQLKVKIKAELEKEGISGATITDYSISTSFFTDDYSPATEEQTTDFYEKVNLAIQRAYDISIILGKQQNTGKLVRTPFTGEKSTASRKQTSSNSQTSQAQELPYQIINGYNVSNYNEGIQQGNARDYSNFYDSNEIIEGTHVTPRQVLGSINRMLSQTEHQLNAVQFFTTPEGDKVYGFVTPEGEIYLDETIIDPSHPIHEYTHLWDRFLIKKKPELWAKGVSLMKQTPLWEKVLNSEQYGKKWISEGKEGEVLDNLIASEVHALLTGEKGKEILEDLAKKKGYKGIVAKLKAWIEEAWKTLKSTFSNWTEEEINNLKIDDFVNMAVRDFADGVNFKGITPQQNAARSALGAYYRWQKEHITKSEKFNEDHTYLLDGNPIADSVTQFWRKLFPEKIDGDHTYASSIGNSVDAIVRDYFKRNNPENTMYPNMTADRRDAIIEDCKRLERELKSRYGENAIIITEEFVLTGNVKAKGLAERVAGTMDMLVIDEAGDLHILDMKAKKGSIDSYNNRRNYTLQLNAYKELLEQCVPAFKGRVKSIDLIWFGQDYPTQGKGVTYTTDTNSGEITVTSGSYTGPMSEYSKWSTPSLSDNWDDALINLDIKPVFDEVTPVWETPKPKEEKSKDTPPSAGSHIDIHKDNPRLKLLKAFTHQQREYRVEMLAWDIHDAITRLIKKRKRNLNDKLKREVENNGDNTELAKILRESLEVYDTSPDKVRRNFIEEVGIASILEEIKRDYREVVDLTEEQAKEEFGENYQYIQDQYKRVLDNFELLLEEVAVKLESLEPFKFNFHKQIVNNGNGDITTDGGNISDSTDDEDRNEENFSDNEEGKKVTGNDGWTFEAKFKEPYKTLTKEVKELLRGLKRVSISGKIERDDLGKVRYVPERYAYACLLAELAPIIDSADFITKLDDGTYEFPALRNMAKNPKYKWVNQIIKALKKDPSLASKMYRNFRKDSVTYYGHRYNPETGKYETFPLNKLTVEDSTMLNVSRNYHNMLMQDREHSIYDNSGHLNKENAKIGLEMVSKLLNEVYFNDEDIPMLVKDVTKILNMLGFSSDVISVERVLGIENDELGGEAIPNLQNLLRAARNIFDAVVNGVKGVQLPENIDYVNYFSTGRFKNNGLITIANAAGVVSENNFSQMFRIDASDYPTYTAPDYSTKVVKILQSDERRDSFLEEGFKPDDWHYHDGRYTGEWLHILSGEMDTEGKEDWEINAWMSKVRDVRAHLAIIDLPVMRNSDGKNVLYRDWTGNQIRKGFIVQYFAAGYNEDSDTQYGWYSFPIFSDSEMARFIRFERYTGDGWIEKMTPLFRGLVKQELRRIQRTRARKAAGVVPIANIDSIGEEKGRGEEICFIPALNDEEFISRCEQLTASGSEDELNDYIDNAVMNAIESDFRGFLEKVDIDNMGSELISQGVIEEYNEDVVIDKLREYFYNQFYASSQIIQLFTGDLAYYRNDIDFQKRFKEVYAGGEKLNTKSPLGKEFEVSLKLKDNIMTSLGYDNIKKVFDRAVAEKRILDIEAEAILRKFRDINASDAQALRSLKSFRSLLDMMGVWNEEMENAFNNFEQGVWTMTDFNTIWQTVKPYLFTNILKSDGLGGQMRVPIQHKDSEALLLSIYQLAAAATDAPVLKALNRFMDDNDIDLVIFESGVKVGCQGPIDLNYSKKKLDNWKDKAEYKEIENAATEKGSSYDIFKSGNDNLLHEGKITQSEYNRRMSSIQPSYEETLDTLNTWTKDASGNLREDIIDTLPYSDYCVQQPNPEHLKDVFNAVFGSQFRNLIYSDLPDDFKMKVNGVELNKEKTLRLYQALIVENLLDGFETLGKKFDSIESLQKFLLQQVSASSKYSRDLLDALQIVEVEHPTISGKKVKTFNLPFHTPTVQTKVLELLYSAAKNAVTKQTIHGGTATLISSYGLTDKLQLIRDKKTGAVRGVECYLPAYSRKFYEAYLEEVTEVSDDGRKITYWKLDIDKVPEELRRAVGYRIPTEDKYSMLPLVIKGFLPEQSGSQIMLPADITTMSGSDFDIDKLYIMLPNFRTEYYDKQRAIKDYEKIKDIEESKDWKSFFEKFGGKDSSLFHDVDLEDILSEAPKDFNDWWSEHKEEYRYDTPVLRKIKYDAEKGPEGNKKVARDNMIIDMAFGILSHPSISENIQNPGSFDTVKAYARVSTILNDRRLLMLYARERDTDDVVKTLLNEARNGWKSLDKFIKANSTPTSVCSIETFIFNHQQNMAGAALIGMYANNTTAQAKNQLISMDMAKPIVINGRGVSSLTKSRVLINGKSIRISKNCAEFSAASVDNGKDPNLAALFQSMETANIMGTMLRMGLTIEEASLLFAHPYVRRLLANTGGDGYKFGKAVDRFINALSKHKLFFKEENLSNTNIISENLVESAIDFNYIEDILGEREHEFTEEEKQAVKNLAAILTMMKKITEVANVVSNITLATRADSPNGALEITPEKAEIQRRNLDILHIKAKRDDCPIKGLDNIISNGKLSLSMSRDEMRKSLMNSQQPMLQGFYSLGIDLAQDFIGKYLVYASPKIKELVKFLHDNSGGGVCTSDVLRELYRNIVKYHLVRSDMFGGRDAEEFERQRKYYLEEYPSKFLNILKEHPELNNIGLINKIIVKKGKIMFDNSGNLDTPTADTFMRDMDMLLFDEDNPAAQELALDLFKYTVYENGLRFGATNLTRFFSTNFLTSIPSVRDAFRNMMFDVEDNDFWARFRDQFMATYGGLTCSKIRANESKDTIDVDGHLILSKGRAKNYYSLEEKSNDYIIYSSDDPAVSGLYKRISESETSCTYEKVKILDYRQNYFHPDMSIDDIWQIQEKEREIKRKKEEELNKRVEEYMKKVQGEESARADKKEAERIAEEMILPKVLPPAGIDSDLPEVLPPSNIDEDPGIDMETYHMLMRDAARQEQRSNDIAPEEANALARRYEEDDSALDNPLCKK